MRPEVKVTVIYKTVCDTLQPQDVATHYIWDSSSNYIGDVPEDKVKVTPKQ